MISSRLTGTYFVKRAPHAGFDMLQRFSVGRADFNRGGRKGARRLADSSQALRSCGDFCG